MRRRTVVGCLSLALAGGAFWACQDRLGPSSFPLAGTGDASPPLLEVSPFFMNTEPRGPSGPMATLGLRWTGTDPAPAGLMATLEWDPAIATLIGQIPRGETLVLLDARELESGRAEFLAVNPWGLPPEFGYFAFRVEEGESPSLRVRGADATLLDLSRPDLRFRSPTPTSDLPDPGGARWMEEADWEEYLEPVYREAAGSHPGLQKVPGGSAIFGDANEDGLVNFSDVLADGRMAQGLEECFIGSVGEGLEARDCIGGNVYPFNTPGLGEPSDPCAPGIDVCGTLRRTVNSSDVVAIARDAVGLDQPVVGEPIPGRMPPGGTVVLSGLITGSQVLTPNNVYVLEGPVTVGDEVGASGDLTIEAGVRLEGAGPDAALVVSRNGRLVARGTQFEPITMDCQGGGSPGCWRGLVVNGNDRVNAGAANPAIPGRTAAGCLQLGGTPEGAYGGCEPFDDSGSLSWIRVLNAGAGGTPAIDLRALGSGTSIRQLYSVGSGGDGIQLRGGTVDLRYVRIVNPGGAALGWDDGWDGRLQYGLIQTGSDTEAAVRGSNSPSDFNASPRARPELRNVSVVGPPDPEAASPGAASVVLTQGTAGVLESFLHYAQPTPGAFLLDVDEEATFHQLEAGTLVVGRSLVVGYSQIGSLDDDPDLPGYYSPDVEGQFFRRHTPESHVSSAFSDVDSVFRGPWEDLPDLRLVSSSLADLTCPSSPDPFFESVTFCGATGLKGVPWGAVPWYEPAPPVPFTREPLDPQPALLMVRVMLAPELTVPVPGVVFRDPYRGVSGLDGWYRAYVEPGPWILSYERFPNGCSVPPDVIVPTGPLQPGETRAFLLDVECSG